MAEAFGELILLKHMLFSPGANFLKINLENTANFLGKPKMVQEHILSSRRKHNNRSIFPGERFPKFH